MCKFQVSIICISIAILAFWGGLSYQQVSHQKAAMADYPWDIVRSQSKQPVDCETIKSKFEGSPFSLMYVSDPENLRVVTYDQGKQEFRVTFIDGEHKTGFESWPQKCTP